MTVGPDMVTSLLKLLTHTASSGSPVKLETVPFHYHSRLSPEKMAAGSTFKQSNLSNVSKGMLKSVTCPGIALPSNAAAGK